MLDVAIESLAYHGPDGRRVAVRDLAFRVQDGEFVCLFGPSGCGKTSTLRAILGLEADLAGSVTSGDAKVAAVFQEPRLLPWRTLDQNVRLVLHDKRKTADLASLYATLGLTEHLGFYPGALSGGLARRAAIARAFATEPAVLVLDEPFVSLDAATAQRLRALLVKLCTARPTATVMVTHDLPEALSLADRIVVMGGQPGTLRGLFTPGVPREQRDIAALADRFARDFG